MVFCSLLFDVGRKILYRDCAVARNFYWLNDADRGFVRGRANADLGAFYTNGNNNATNNNTARASVVCGVGLLYGKIYKIYFKSEGCAFTEATVYYI